jgi:hypothetical protein
VKRRERIELTMETRRILNSTIQVSLIFATGEQPDICPMRRMAFCRYKKETKPAKSPYSELPLASIA